MDAAYSAEGKTLSILGDSYSTFAGDIPEGQAICHQMGRPQEQRLVWLHNEQAITAPEWSVHSAAGTSNYMFIWGMAGENLNYGDMDKVNVTDMR